MSATDEPAVTVTVYTRENCTMCHKAIETVEDIALTLEGSVALDTVNVDTDPALAAEYGERVPCVFIDGELAFTYDVDGRSLRLRLLAAANK